MPPTDDERSRVTLPIRAQQAPDRKAGPLLAVDGLRKWWPGRREPTLDDLDLELTAGDVVSVTGPNGAGKTTLLRIIGGLVTPDRGSVHLAGIRLGTRRRAYQRQLGLLSPGDRSLYARVTVQHHLDLWGRLALLAPDARRAAMAYCSARFELAEISQMRVDRLSMGQRQRLRLALTFLHSPQLVLLDEPATSLDLAALQSLRLAVEDLAERGGACLAVAPEGADTGIGIGQRFVLRDGRVERA
jgi:ABC-type multidrug transport system ATPase subunit